MEADRTYSVAVLHSRTQPWFGDEEGDRYPDVYGDWAVRQCARLAPLPLYGGAALHVSPISSLST